MTEPYKTGYKRPPLKSRFQPGQSGNLKGRPRKDETKLNLTAIIDAVLKELVTVKENGRSVKMSRLEVVARNYIQKAMSGDLRALRELAKLANQSEVLVDPPHQELPPVLVVPEVSKSIEEWEAAARKTLEWQKKLIAGELDKPNSQ